MVKDSRSASPEPTTTSPKSTGARRPPLLISACPTRNTRKPRRRNGILSSEPASTAPPRTATSPTRTYGRRASASANEADRAKQRIRRTRRSNGRQAQKRPGRGQFDDPGTILVSLPPAASAGKNLISVCAQIAESTEIDRIGDLITHQRVNPSPGPACRSTLRDPPPPPGRRPEGERCRPPGYAAEGHRTMPTRHRSQTSVSVCGRAAHWPTVAVNWG